MQKGIQILFIAIIISSCYFAYAIQANEKIEVNKGWNILNDFINVNQITGGDIHAQNIKAIYLLKQPSKEYVRIYPNPEEEKLKDINGDYYVRASLWVYINKTGILEYKHNELNSKENKIENQMYPGWNMITVKKEYKGLTLANINGTCSIEDVYSFNTKEQQWTKELFASQNPTEVILKDKHVGNGIMLRVKNDCTMFASEEKYQKILEGIFS